MRINQQVGNKSFKAASKAMLAGWAVATSLLPFLDAQVVAELGATRATITVATTRVQVEVVGPFHHITTSPYFKAVVHETEVGGFYAALWGHIDECSRLPLHRMPPTPYAVRRFKV